MTPSVASLQCWIGVKQLLNRGALYAMVLWNLPRITRKGSRIGVIGEIGGQESFVLRSDGGAELPRITRIARKGSRIGVIGEIGGQESSVLRSDGGAELPRITRIARKGSENWYNS
jgi:hypothetical protein